MSVIKTFQEDFKIENKRNNFRCSNCGCNVFYIGKNKNILCTNCLTEYLYGFNIIVRELDNLKLKQLDVYGGAKVLKDIKQNNYKMYKRILKNSGLLQRIHYLLLRTWIFQI